MPLPSHPTGHERFVGEAITPVAGSFDSAAMASGEPGIPQAFVWRGRTVEVTAVLRRWHDTGPCSHGSGEMYVRKHWFEVATTAGIMKVYFDRQPRYGRRDRRWWLFSIREEDNGSSPF